MESTQDSGAWSLPTRLLFRFCLIYVLLYSHPFPVQYLPTPEGVGHLFGQEWSWAAANDWFYTPLRDYAAAFTQLDWKVVDWTAHTVFGLDVPLIRQAGSGDTTHNFVELFVHAVLAAFGCLVWSLLARRRRSHRLLGAWAHLGLRFFLAFIMLRYGFGKVFPNQFQAPSLARLVAEYGDTTPMAVLWTFIGSSTAYTVFGGAGEVLAGLLLLFRRTATLGALLTAAVMTNVVAMNLCYDVPVKLYSTHLLLFALALCAPDLRRLLRVLVLNHPTAPRDLRTPHLPWVGWIVTVLVVVPLLGGMVRAGYERFTARPANPALYGIWDVQRYAVGGQDVPPLTTDPVRWQNLLIDAGNEGVVRGMDGVRYGRGLEFAEDGASVTVSSSSTWEYRLEADGTLVLAGEFARRGPEDRSKPVDSKTNPSIWQDPQLTVRLQRRGPPVEAVEASAGKAPAIPPGTWEVTGTETGEFFLPRHRADPSGFKKLVIPPAGDAIEVVQENDRVDRYTMTVDAGAGRLVLASKATFKIEKPADGRLILRGDDRGHAVEVELEQRDLREYQLLRRGFNWINEFPFGRY